MEINYTLLGIILILSILLIIFLIWKNRKDQKEYEQQKFRSEIEPPKHRDPETKI